MGGSSREEKHQEQVRATTWFVGGELNGSLGTSGEEFGPSIPEQEEEEELFSTLAEEPLGRAPIQAYTFNGKPITFRPKVKKTKLNVAVSPELNGTIQISHILPVVNITRVYQQVAGCTDS